MDDRIGAEIVAYDRHCLERAIDVNLNSSGRAASIVSGGNMVPRPVVHFGWTVNNNGGVSRAVCGVTTVHEETERPCSGRSRVCRVTLWELTIVNKERVAFKGRSLLSLCHNEFVDARLGRPNPGVDAEWIRSL